MIFVQYKQQVMYYKHNFFGTDIAVILGRVYRGFLILEINVLFLLMLMRYSPFLINIL